MKSVSLIKVLLIVLPLYIGCCFLLLWFFVVVGFFSVCVYFFSVQRFYEKFKAMPVI